MNIDKTSLAYIQNVVRTAELVKIGNIIIEPDRVRAIDEDRTVILFQNKDVPEMVFGSIGLNRIDDFSSRFDIARSIDNFQVDVLIEGDDTKTSFARSLTMKAKGIKIDYRCANPATIQAPKTINDAPKYQIRMTPEAVLLMQKAQGAMHSDEISFIGSDEGVSFEVVDINTDKMAYKFADRVAMVGDSEDTLVKFNHKYPIKTVTTLFKTAPDGSFTIGARGMLKIVVNNLDVYILPRT